MNKERQTVEKQKTQNMINKHENQKLEQNGKHQHQKMRQIKKQKQFKKKQQIGGTTTKPERNLKSKSGGNPEKIDI